MQIVTKSIPELNIALAEAWTALSDAHELIREIVEEINFGEDLSLEGELIFGDLRSVDSLLSVISNVLPDEISDTIFWTEE